MQAKNPSPDEIKNARLAAGLTQKQAGQLIGYSRRSWQEWEYGGRKMRWITFSAFKKSVIRSFQ